VISGCCLLIGEIIQFALGMDWDAQHRFRDVGLIEHTIVAIRWFDGGHWPIDIGIWFTIGIVLLFHHGTHTISTTRLDG